MKKRITALLLAFAMLFTLSAAALAADESALVPEPAAAEPAAETPTPLPEATEAKTGAPAEQLAAPRPVLRAVETAATHTAHPYCGDAACDKHGEAIAEWTDLNKVAAGSTLEAGKAYYLTNNLNVSKSFIVDGGEITLCLNGYTLTNSSGVQYQRALDVRNGTLRICDCSQDATGAITSNTPCDGSALFLRYTAGKTPAAELYGGTITGTNTANSGGAVCLATGKFTMYGGKIANSRSKMGGGVYVSSGTFTMNGGTITGCTATENGGGVYLNGGTFIVSGTATITGNHVGKADNNVYLPAGKTITADDLTSGAQIGVTAASAPTAITGTNDADIHNYFTSDNSAYEPWNGTDNAVVLRTARTTPTCNAPSGLTAVYGQKLSEIELTNPEGNTPGTWTWENGNQDVGDVGGHTFKATFTPTDGDSYKTVTGIDVTVTVTQADQTITISGESKKTIIHNGKPYSIDYATALGGAAITYSLESTIEGVSLGADAKTLTVQPAVEADTVITIRATAAATENYKETYKTFIVTVAAKSDIELTITMDGWTYGETANTPTYTKPESGGTETVTYAVKDTTAFSNTVPTDVGEYVVKVVYETDTAIYFGTENFTIAKADGSVTEPTGKTELVYTGQAQELLETEATSATGTVQYKLDDGAWSETAPTATDAGTYKVYYRSVGDENHESTGDDAYITVEIAKKPIDVPAEDTTAFIYNGADQTYAVAGSTDYTVTGNTQKNAGTQDVIIALADKANTEWKDKASSDDLTYTFTIAQAKLTLRALDKKITAGQPAPDLKNPVLNEDYTVEGTLYGGDTLDITMAYDPAGTGKAGTYTITIAAAAMANYDITTVPGTLTVEAVQTSQKLGISTPPRTPGGTLELTPKNAKPGDTVTITVKPDKGFELGGLTVRDVNGDKLDLIRECDNEFSFTMPKSSVKISASFVAENDDVLFRDVPTGAYFYDAVKWARQNGITDGIGDGLFGAAFPCTRVQIVTFLWRAAGSPEPQNDVTFTDVPSSAYYAKAVAWAVEEGITNGVGGGKFDPDAPCTRAQAVAFLYRAAGEPAVRSAAEFDDVAENSYYAAAVAWAQRQSITDGVTPTRFAPDDDCTRAQIVTFLYRAFAE